MIRDFARVYERCDVLLAPTSPTVAFPLGAKTADPLEMYLSDVCTIPSSLAGHAAMSVPFGAGEGGLPVGVQVLAPALGEPVMFRVARRSRRPRRERRTSGRRRVARRASGRHRSSRPARGDGG